MQIRESQNIISWILVAFALLSLAGTIGWILFFDEFVREKFFDPYVGKYWWAAWVKTVSRIFVPLILLKSSNRRKISVIIAITILINISWIIDFLVVSDLDYDSDLDRLALQRLCSGAAFGIIIITMENLIHRFRPAANQKF